MNLQDFLSIGINIGLLIIAIVFIKNLSKQNILIKNKISLNISLVLVIAISFLIIMAESLLTTFLPLINNIFIIPEQKNILNPINWFLNFCLIAPVLEEIIFRFGVFEKYKNRTSTSFLIIISSVLFSLLHGYSLIGFITIFILAIMLHISYLKTNNLANPILIHAIYNFINELVLNSVTIYPSFNTFVIIVAAIFLAIFIILIIFRRKSKSFQ